MKKIYLASRYDYNKSYVNVSLYNIFNEIDDIVLLPLPFYLNKDKLEFALNDASGLIIPGGIDLNPKTYNQKLINSDFIDILDEYDFLLLELAIKKNIPILGICRGIQLINVFFKGSLVQDIKGHQKSYHTITFSDEQKELVNSYHHQAIATLGNDLLCLAKSDDGIIEAIRHKSKPIIAVQWHPELQVDHFINKKLINDFLNIIK